jgi:lipoate-protein ligase A
MLFGPGNFCTFPRMVNFRPATWFLLESGVGAHDFNMAQDEALLELAADVGHPVLRFYGWAERAASFGYSQRFSEMARATSLRPLVRRPTGGGLVPHDADWTYSLVFPPQHPWYRFRATDSYQLIHEWIRDAFAKLDVPTTLAPCCQKEIPGQCFVGAEKFDLLWHGKKIAGAAQRRTRQGLLAQGSVQPPPIGLSRLDWQKAMTDVAEEQFAADWHPLEVAGVLGGRTAELAQTKYSQRIYNEKR